MLHDGVFYPTINWVETLVELDIISNSAKLKPILIAHEVVDKYLHVIEKLKKKFDKSITWWSSIESEVLGPKWYRCCEIVVWKMLWGI